MLHIGVRTILIGLEKIIWNSFEDGDIRSGEKYLVREIKAGTSGSTDGHTYGVGDVIIYCPKDEMI